MRMKKGERRRIDLSKDARRLAQSGKCANWRAVDGGLRDIGYTADETRNFFRDPVTKSQFDEFCARAKARLAE